MADPGTTRVWRRDPSGRWRRMPDQLAVEEPLELRVNGASLSITLRTPGHDEELAAGFLLAEGVIRGRTDLLGLRPYPRNAHGNVLDVVLADGVDPDWKRLSRHVVGSSSCGLCGAATLAALRRRFPRIRERCSIVAPWLLECAEVMRAAQAGFRRTGGLHAAARFAAGGGLVCLREDVGRHNAVDKVVGRAVLDGAVPCRESVLFVSGRLSLEIIQKSLAAGFAIVAAVGAPSSLAVDFARANGQTLIGFVRDGRLNVYTGRSRVRAAGSSSLSAGWVEGV